MKKMYRYKIHTENVNFQSIIHIIHKYFNCCTIYKSTGIWMGMAEFSLVIEILMPKNQMVDVEAACREINRLNHQECCLVTMDRVNTIFVFGSKKQLSSAEIAK